MEQQCPKCRLINRPDATRCDCGWDFTAGQDAAVAFARDKSVADRAKASWVCPLVAWLSQFMLATTMGGMRGMALVWLIAMLVQAALIIGGVVLGINIVKLGRSKVRPADWKAAWAGIIFSGGTILLILAMLVSAMVSG